MAIKQYWVSAFITLIILIAIAVASIYVIELTDKRNTASESITPPLDGKTYKIGVLNYTISLNEAIKGFKSRMSELDSESGFNIYYQELKIPFTQLNIKRAGEFFSINKVDLILTGQSAAIILKEQITSIPIIAVLSSTEGIYSVIQDKKTSGNNLVFINRGSEASAPQRFLYMLEVMPELKLFYCCAVLILCFIKKLY